MPTIQFRSADTHLLTTLVEDLKQDLQQAGIADDLQLSDAKPLPEEQPELHRGDPISLSTILLTAAGAGGALTVLLGKDGFLSSLARVLEKYVEGRQVEVIIEDGDKKTQLSGPVGEIKDILKQLRP